MALAQGSALKRDNWSPGDPRRGGRLWHFDRRFRQLLGYSEHVLAPLHFLPDILRHHASPRPQHGEVIKKVGAFTDHGVALAVDGIDHDLDGFLGQLLRHLGWATLKQPCRSRNCRIEILGRDDCLVKPFERITHRSKVSPNPWTAR